MVDVISAQAPMNKDSSGSNIGKVIGSSLGTAYGGYKMYQSIKNGKEIDQFLSTDAGKKVLNSSDSENINKLIKESDLSNKIKNELVQAFALLKRFHNSDQKLVENIKYVLEGSAKPNKAVGVLLVGLTALFGLGIGAIVDHFRNNGNDEE